MQRHDESLSHFDQDKCSDGQKILIQYSPFGKKTDSETEELDDHVQTFSVFMVKVKILLSLP